MKHLAQDSQRHQYHQLAIRHVAWSHEPKFLEPFGALKKVTALPRIGNRSGGSSKAMPRDFTRQLSTP